MVFLCVFMCSYVFLFPLDFLSCSLVFHGFSKFFCGFYGFSMGVLGQGHEKRKNLLSKASLFGGFKASKVLEILGSNRLVRYVIFTLDWTPSKARCLLGYLVV